MCSDKRSFVYSNMMHQDVSRRICSCQIFYSSSCHIPLTITQYKLILKSIEVSSLTFRNCVLSTNLGYRCNAEKEWSRGGGRHQGSRECVCIWVLVTAQLRDLHICSVQPQSLESLFSLLFLLCSFQHFIHNHLFIPTRIPETRAD